MKVVICEDNAVFAKQVESYIMNYAFMEDNGIKVVLNTTFPYELEKYIQIEQVDCFFLDIDFGQDITGLDLAKIIRKSQPLASIIFITTRSEMLYLTFKYQVEALDFIIKDESTDLHQAIVKALAMAFEKYKKIGERLNNRYYQIKMGEYVRNINLDDILYFKVGSLAHKVILSTKQGQFEFHQSLNEIEDFDEMFFRCHRSFIIYIENIQEVNWKLKTVVMKNGDKCPLAFRKLKPLKEVMGY